MQTDSCWAFAGIGMLESSLGMNDYKLKNTQNIYDFSERHMFYASKRSFLIIIKLMNMDTPQTILEETLMK